MQDPLANRLSELEIRIAVLESRLADLASNSPTDNLEKRIDRIEKRSGLMSRSWFNRAFTTWAYVSLIQLIFAAAIGIIFFFFGSLVGTY